MTWRLASCFSVCVNCNPKVAVISKCASNRYISSSVFFIYHILSHFPFFNCKNCNIRAAAVSYTCCHFSVCENCNVGETATGILAADILAVETFHWLYI